VRLNLLLVEENSSLRTRWVDRLREQGHRIFAFADARGALEAAGQVRVDLAVLSFANPAACLELQKALKERNPACQVTLLSERPTAEHDAMVLEAGARSVLLKPVPEEAIERVVSQATRSRQKNAALPSTRSLEAILGRSEPILRIQELIRKVASTADTSVLITGESGTGKELAARAVHDLSSRREEAFLEVNCAAIPENLLESELFGHEPGAFTDADRAKPGLFELASRGTVFLDEIGEMNLELQAKLLRVIDTRSIRRLAGQDKIALDVRIIAATNRDLAREVQDRRFRDDLFHRLNVIPIHLPPLRERGDDLHLLADHFLEQMGRKFGRPKMSLSEDARCLMAAYAWPGNVRELMHLIERAVLLSRQDVLGPADFPLLASQGGEAPETVWITGACIKVDFRRGPVSLDVVEREIISRALEEADWNISEAARLLGIGRGALRYKIERHRIERRLMAGYPPGDTAPPGF
jgi:DNA-binding NtrC family response regulator